MSTPEVEPRAVLPPFNWRVPVLGDVPNVPSDMTNLATDISTTVLKGMPIFPTNAARDAAIPAPVVGQHCFVNNLTVSVGGLTQRYEGGAWKVIAGDTGWRNINAGLLAGWTCAAGDALTVRRVGAIVHLRCGQLQKSGGAPGATAVYPTAPAGFAPSLAGQEVVANSWDPVTSGQLLSTKIIISSPWLYIYDQTAGKTLGQLNYHTDAVWPTTLPGIPF